MTDDRRDYPPEPVEIKPPRVSEGTIFEDLHDYDGGQIYVAPNEYTLTWREILKGRHIERAAGICSSGEVGLFSMLPTVRKELVLVDHSYRSLAIAMCKYFVLQKHGADEAHKLFSGDDVKALNKALDEAVKNLPGKVAEIVKVLRKNSNPYHDSYYNKWFTLPAQKATGGYYPREAKKARVSAEVKGEWKNLPKPLIRCATTKLDKVVFLHGDLADLVDRGPFDLIYLSNALEHTSRTGKAPITDTIEKALKPGGYALVAYRPGYYAKRLPETWEAVTTIKGKGGTEMFDLPIHKIAWDHTLFQVPKAA